MDTIENQTADAIVDAVVKELREKIMVEVEASGRHVHLCHEDVEALFGAGHRLTPIRDLSQPGQYVCEERVTLKGPKGTIQHVVVLGPERSETQVEISMTDSVVLGVRPPVRLSGDIEGTPGIVMSVGEKEITKNRGVMIAQRHMHITPKDACRLGVKDKEILKIKVFGNRPTIFLDTVARVSEKFATYIHIDYDEANACGFQKGTFARIIR